jgi:uncharacterized protein
MKRKATERLKSWIQSKNRKPMVIRGARQVGKSTLIRHFAKDHGLVLHEINLERHVNLDNIFQTFDTQRIIQELEFIIKKGSIQKSGGLLFLDEIQATPSAIQALRYFYEDYPDLPVIAAGSLLEFVLAKHSFSMPVGRVEYLFLNPMTFEEVLQASDEMDLLNLLNQYSHGDIIPDTAHQRLLEHQRKYLLIGGMPEAVGQFIESGSFMEASDVQASILETYRDDFSKYASQAELLRLHKIFDYVPGAVGEKLKYVRIDPHETARELRKALDLLVKARIINLCFHSDATGFPLKALLNRRIFKPFFLDCGLMNFLCGFRNITMNQLLRREFVNEGKMAEQFIAQHLLTIERSNVNVDLFYWLRESKKSNAEVDFIIQSNQKIIPIEIKAGQSGSLKSLHQFVLARQTKSVFRFDLNKPSFQTVQHKVVTKDDSADIKMDLYSLPLYMIEQLHRLVPEEN